MIRIWRVFPLAVTMFLSLSLSSCDQDLAGIGLSDMTGAGMKYDDSGATRRLKVASAAVECSLAPDTNLSRVVAMIDSIKNDHPDVRLIVFGETILGWYYFPDDPRTYQRSVAQPVPGPVTDSLGKTAQAYDIYIALGMAEMRGKDLYNSAVLINPSGEVQAVHSKIELTSLDLESGYLAGTRNDVTYIDGIKTGLFVCADVETKPNLRAMADEGIELLVHPWASVNAFTSGVDPSARILNSWVITANRCGNEDIVDYKGIIYISDPAGTHRAFSKGSPGYVFADIGVY
jgi:predicted amidohydrolase